MRILQLLKNKKVLWPVVGVSILVVILMVLVVPSNAPLHRNSRPAQGVEGRVTVIQCKTVTSDDCAKYRFTVTARTSDAVSVVATSAVDTQGNYSIGLEPGTYQIAFSSNPGGTLPFQQTVTVKPKQYATSNFRVSIPEYEEEQPEQNPALAPPDPNKFH